MSIQRRTIFYDIVAGTVRFNDWAMTTTTLGAMAEPFLAEQRHQLHSDFGNYDFSDEACRVDDIRQLDSNKAMLALSGGDHQLHGGVMLPRVGP